MSRLYFAAPGRVKLVLLALALLPCAPGLTFLLAGWARDPVHHRHAPSEATAAEIERASEQTHALYLTGGAALGVGGLCGLAVVWTVVRRRDAEEDERSA